MKRSDIPESVAVLVEKTYARTGDMMEALKEGLAAWPGAEYKPRTPDGVIVYGSAPLSAHLILPLPKAARDA